MRQRARDAQKILKMLPQQREERRYTNVLGKEWVSWSSNETAKNPVAPRWLLSLLPTQAGWQQDCFSMSSALGWHIRVTNVSLSV